MTGRNNNKNMPKKKKNTTSTVTSATIGSESLQAGADPSTYGSYTSYLPMETQASTTPPQTTKGKKRNKNVIATDENEGVAPKKVKTEDRPLPKRHDSRVFQNSLMKKLSNKVFKDPLRDDDMDLDSPSTSTATAAAPKRLKRKAETKDEEEMQTTNEASANKRTDNFYNRIQKQRKRKGPKKPPKLKTEEVPIPMLTMPRLSIGSSEEELTEVLGNMQIEYNPYNISDVANEMVPSAHVPRRPNVSRQSNSDDDSNEFDLNKVVEWTRNNWNRDRIDAITVDDNSNAVVIENMPFDLIPIYKDKLTDLFDKYGRITHIGAAEMQDSVGDQPTYNTTIYFDSEEAAINALDEDNAYFGGTRIRVLRPLPVIDVPMVHCQCNHEPIETEPVFSGGPARFVTNRARAAAFVNDGTGAIRLRLAISAIIEILA